MNPRRPSWRRARGRFGRVDEIVVPAWMLAAPAALLPAWWLRRHLANRRGSHECEACGYDLRGSPGAACPECGVELSSGKSQPVRFPT